MVHLIHDVLEVMVVWSWSKTHNLRITCKILDFSISSLVLSNFSSFKNGGVIIPVFIIGIDRLVHKCIFSRR